MDTSGLLQLLSTTYLQAIRDISGVSLSIEKYSDHELSSFQSPANMITILDFSGAVMGFLAVSLDEEVAAKVLDLGSLPPENERGKLREEYSGFFKEVLNSVSGDCILLLQDDYPFLTILPPKLIYGAVSYPRVTCYMRQVQTNIGTFNFYFSVDKMKLGITGIRERLEHSEDSLSRMLQDLRTVDNNETRNKPLDTSSLEDDKVSYAKIMEGHASSLLTTIKDLRDFSQLLSKFFS